VNKQKEGIAPKKMVAVSVPIFSDEFSKMSVDNSTKKERLPQAVLFDAYSWMARDAYNWVIEIYTLYHRKVQAFVSQEALRLAKGDAVIAKGLKSQKVNKEHGWDRNAVYKDAEAIYGKDINFSLLDTLFKYAKGLDGSTNKNQPPQWMIDFVRSDSHDGLTGIRSYFIDNVLRDHYVVRHPDFTEQVVIDGEETTQRISFPVKFSPMIARQEMDIAATAIKNYRAKVVSGERPPSKKRKPIPVEKLAKDENGVPYPDLPGGFPRRRSPRDDNGFTLKMTMKGIGSSIGVVGGVVANAKSNKVRFGPLGTLRTSTHKLNVARDTFVTSSYSDPDKEFSVDQTTVRFREHAGKWSFSLALVMPNGWHKERPLAYHEKRLTEGDAAVGIDIGVRTIIARSDGKTYPNPRVVDDARVDDFVNSDVRWKGDVARAERLLHLQDRQKALQRVIAKKTEIAKVNGTDKKVSNSVRKLYTKLARIAAEETQIRKHIRHEVSKSLVETFDFIAMEDLNTKGMLSKVLPKEHPDLLGEFLANGRAAQRSRSREIGRVSFGDLKVMIEYKSAYYGTTVQKVSQWYASSQICSGCQSRYEVKSSKVYNCPTCGLVIDRDMNAAINILREAKRRASTDGEASELDGSNVDSAAKELLGRLESALQIES